MKSQVPEARRSLINTAPVRAERAFVLYWMVAQRRASHNFALDRAIEWAKELKKPLVVFEPLRAGYRWASARLHRFVAEGMQAQARAFARAPITYYPYVEPRPGEADGLLAALGAHSTVVVTDEYPAFFLPNMLSSAGLRLDVQLEAIDSNGLLPLRGAPRDYPSAYTFRRHLQKTLRPHLLQSPSQKPLHRLSLPALGPSLAPISTRWPAPDLEGSLDWLSSLPIDQGVGPGPLVGGSDAARDQLRRFIEHGLSRYATERSEPAQEVASGLSPYLHFGHISAHEVTRVLLDREDWDPSRLASKHDGSKAGWWGVSENLESFLDELVTWRELGFNFAHHRRDHDEWSSLPEWAITTLEQHAMDPRPWLYDLAALDAGRTHDPIWNAAQRQLREEGRIQNYLRMLWGKKILEWSPHPKRALEIMAELNNRYAIDGRDPNSYSGIFWILGRYDRPWGPERPIFGKVRYMSSDNTRRKFELGPYLERYGDRSPQLGLGL